MASWQGRMSRRELAAWRTASAQVCGDATPAAGPPRREFEIRCDASLRWIRGHPPAAFMTPNRWMRDARGKFMADSNDGPALESRTDRDRRAPRY
ncbi:hypothetical protein [Lysobacter gummosus]|uniref:hypothetical protein n=1 Tax=Lysobacter gummosus TaxID=262324 RepID=UPI003638DE67